MRRQQRVMAAWRFGGLVLGSLAALSTPSMFGCSLIYNSAANQCSTDGDCTSRGAAFAGTVCDTGQRICVQNPTLCKTNQECITGHGNQPYRCLNQTCVSLLSLECTNVLGENEDLANDNAVYIGEEYGISTDLQNLEASQATDLVRKDWKKANGGGLPPAAAGGPIRPAVFIVCDVNNDAQAKAATTHLVNDVQVPAILGFRLPNLVADAAPIAFPKQVALLQNGSAAAAQTNLPGRDGLLFRLAGVDVDNVTATLYTFKTVVQPAVAAQIGAANPVKVLVAQKNDPYGQGFLAALNASAPELVSSSNYTLVNYGDPQNDPNSDVKVADAVFKILEFQPHIILFASNEDPATIYRPVEAQWTNPDYRPYYVVGPAATGPATMSQWAASAGIPGLSHRVLGPNAAPPPTDPVFGPWRQRFAAENNGEIASPFPGWAFDYTNLVFFAISAVGDAPLTGKAIGAQMLRFGPRDPGTMPVISSGPTSISMGLGYISQNVAFHFVGVANPFQFTPQGDSFADVIMLCANPKFSPTTPIPWLFSGLRYQSQTQQFTGAFNCPP